MAQNDMLRRYLDAGMAFTQMTRERAEAIVKDLVKAGEIRRKEAEQQIEELLERSRKNTEDLMEMVRTEVADQLRAMGRADLAERAGRGRRGAKRSPASGAEPAPEESEPEGSPLAKKAPAKKAPAKKSAPAKKAASEKKSGPSA